MSPEQVTHFVCPKCNNRFRRGPDARFGPAAIKCGKCGEVSATGLTEWARLPLQRKLAVGLLEVVNPFHTRNVLYFILFHAGLYLLIAIPLGFLMSGLGLQPGGLSHDELKSWKEVAPFVIGGVIYVILLTLLLIWRIVESQRYTRTGTPPTWN